MQRRLRPYTTEQIEQLKQRWIGLEGLLETLTERLRNPDAEKFTYRFIEEYLNAFSHVDANWVEHALETLLFVRESGATGAAFEHRDPLRDISEYGMYDDHEFWPVIDLRGASFHGANLEGALLAGSWLDHADFESANLRRADFGDATCLGANFSEAQLDECASTGSFGHANFCEATINNGAFYMVSFQKARLDGVQFEGCEFETCSLDKASVKATRTEPYETTVRPKLTGCRFFQQSSMVELEAKYADFSGSTFRGVDFSGARLFECDLSRTLLYRCDFAEAQLEQCKISESEVGLCDFSGASLRHSDLNDSVVRLARWNTATGAGGLAINRADFPNSRQFERHIKDAQWLEEFRAGIEKGPARRKVLAWFWQVTSNYGRSVWRLAGWCTCVILIFALAFHAANIFSDTQAVALVREGPELKGLWESVHLSVDIFTNLGMSRAEALTPLGAVLIWVEAVLGWISLGSLLTLLANYATRRS